ncbi:hypothetical protein FF1_045994 [Malus domestica]
MLMSMTKKNCRRGCNNKRRWSREESAFSVVEKFGLEDEVEERTKRKKDEASRGTETDQGMDGWKERKKKNERGDGRSENCSQPRVPRPVTGEREVKGRGGGRDLDIGIGGEKCWIFRSSGPPHSNDIDIVPTFTTCLIRQV